MRLNTRNSAAAGASGFVGVKLYARTGTTSGGEPASLPNRIKSCAGAKGTARHRSKSRDCTGSGLS